MEQDTTTRQPVNARLSSARAALVAAARDYAAQPDPEVWRDLCKAKATLDALLRVAR